MQSLGRLLDFYSKYFKVNLCFQVTFKSNILIANSYCIDFFIANFTKDTKKAIQLLFQEFSLTHFYSKHFYSKFIFSLAFFFDIYFEGDFFRRSKFKIANLNVSKMLTFEKLKRFVMYKTRVDNRCAAAHWTATKFRLDNSVKGTLKNQILVVYIH